MKQENRIAAQGHLLLIMSVNPGFGGQQFIKTTLPKIIKAKKMLSTLSNKPLLEVDGGVNLKNIEGIARAGADVLVAGASRPLHNYIKLTILSFRASGARRRACPVLDTGESSIINGFLDTGLRRYDD
jgi:pentose-5-phosphate-3-epimerase